MTIKKNGKAPETKKRTIKKQIKKPIVRKKPVKKEVKIERLTRSVPPTDKQPLERIWGTGKRKTSIAQVQCFPQGEGKILINERTLENYFPIFELKKIVLDPLKLLNKEKAFDFKIKVKGGGIRGQAEAIRLGIARSLVLFNQEWRKELKSAGFLKRDSRIKERKKPGLKRARRAPQWQKR